MTSLTVTPRRQNARLAFTLWPLNRRWQGTRLVYTAPSGERYWFDVTLITFDESAFDEAAGEWGVFWVEGTQHYIDSQGVGRTMGRCVPGYTLAKE